MSQITMFLARSLPLLSWRDAFFASVYACFVILSGCSSSADTDNTTAGIEGSGSPVVAKGSITENITDTRSLTINGVRFDTSDAQVNINNDNGEQSDLAAGQVVTITGQLNDDGMSGTASKVDYITNIQGPVSSVNALTNTLRILNQVVAINSDTQLGDGIELNNLAQLALGTSVQVSGLLTSSGELVATRIDRVADTVTVQLVGVITNIDPDLRQFLVNEQAVDFGQAIIENTPALSNGQSVFIEGVLDDDAVLIASTVSVQESLPTVARQQLDIEGLIASFNAVDDFSLVGVQVTTTETTVYINGSPDDLGVNTAINVKGPSNSDGVLVAEQIEFIPINIDILVTSKVQGTLQSNDIDLADTSIVGALRMLDLNLFVSDATQYTDKSTLDVPFTSFADIQLDDRLDVRGIFGGETIRVTNITRLDHDVDSVRLRGLVNTVSEALLVVQGVNAFFIPETVFIDVNGDVINQSAFLSKASGFSVLIDGQYTESSIDVDRVQLIVNPNGSLLIGTPGKDTLIGTNQNDRILGGDSRDVIVGAGGDDELDGGSGNDWLYGDSGDDNLMGGPGSDRLFPGVGSDTVDGGSDHDVVHYETSTSGIQIGLDGLPGTGGSAEGDMLINIEQIKGSEFDDILTGNNIHSRLEGFGGNDELSVLGGQYNILRGHSGNDILRGGTGSDTLSGGEDNDQLYGNGGDDRLFPGAGVDIVDGGEGDDYVSFDSSPASIQLTLNGEAGVGGHAEGDTLINVEKVAGSEFDDRITGNNDNNELFGRDGRDVLVGLDGNDRLFGGNDNDELRGGEGDDSLSGDDGDDQLFGEAGNDRISPGAGIDIVDGGSHTITDTVRYRDSPEGVTIALDGSIGSGGHAEGDRLTNIERLEGSDFDDILTGSNIKNDLLGYAGNDQLFGLAGDDFYHIDVSGGRDQVIEDSDNTVDIDTVLFVGNLAHNQLWFSRNNDHLLISIINTEDSVQINNWFSQGASIERFRTLVGTTLELQQADVAALITTMIIVTPPENGVFTVSDSELAQVIDVMNALWNEI